MPVSPRASEWFRGPELGLVVEEDHFLSRMAVLLAGAMAITVLVRGATALGWSSPGGLLAGTACIFIAAATVWGMTRFGSRHLVLIVDGAGITFGPGLWAYLRRLSVRDFTPWHRIGSVRFFTLDYASEPEGHSLIRAHLQITDRDGHEIERALPPSVDLSAVERALRQFTPRAPSADVAMGIPHARLSLDEQRSPSGRLRWTPRHGMSPGDHTALIIALDGFR